MLNFNTYYRDLPTTEKRLFEQLLQEMSVERKIATANSASVPLPLSQIETCIELI